MLATVEWLVACRASAGDPVLRAGGCRLLGLGIGDQVAIAHRSVGDGEFEYAVKGQAPAARSPSIGFPATLPRPQPANATSAPAVAVTAVRPSEQDPSTMVQQDADRPSAPSPTATRVQRPAFPRLSADQAREITLEATAGGVIQSVAADHHGAHDAWAVRVLRGDGSIATAYVDVSSGALYDWVLMSTAPQPSSQTSQESSPEIATPSNPDPLPLRTAPTPYGRTAGHRHATIPARSAT